MTNLKLALLAGGAIGLVATQSLAALTSTDRIFAQKAAQGGLAEVALGQLADQNGGTEQVKEFGQRMVSDHSRINQQLQQIAQKDGLTLPSAPATKDQTTQKRLSTLKGGSFDSAYTRDMITDHQQDIAEFQKEAQSGQDPELKAFAQQTLPVLQQHLQMAEAMKPNQ